LEKPDSQRPLWLPYVEVDRVDEQTEHARELGAGVLLEPREGPAGWRSVVSAPHTRLRDAYLEPKRKRPYGCMRSRKTRSDEWYAMVLGRALAAT
jgi:hypothetical protein